ncbi:hypothetical protein AB0K93_19475 [Streptomyces sp. NPDC052676]|uniref:hypothetical protein n=1 Tax=Streptomyces sp. NPDC052676 TaxID=3154953 RepID=UPI00342AA52E
MVVPRRLGGSPGDVTWARSYRAAFAGHRADRAFGIALEGFPGNARRGPADA